MTVNLNYLPYLLFAGNRDGGRVLGRRQLRHLPAVRRVGAPLEQLLEHLPRTEGHPVTTTQKRVADGETK
jgi:hypothetical protein